MKQGGKKHSSWCPKTSQKKNSTVSNKPGPEYSIIRSVGCHLILNFEIQMLFFLTPGIPREVVIIHAP